MMRFERFTERAQAVAARAYEILQRYGHNQVDSEHILLAILEQTADNSNVSTIFQQLDIEPAEMQKRIDQILRASPKAAIYGSGSGHVFITPRVKRIIDLSNEEANRLRMEYIGPEHLLLAMLKERNTAVAKIFTDNGITYDNVYEIITSAVIPPQKSASLAFGALGEHEIARFVGHQSAVSAVAFSPDGYYILTGCTDGTARLWETNTGKQVREFAGHQGSITSIAFSPDGRRILTGGADGTARLWKGIAAIRVKE